MSVGSAMRIDELLNGRQTRAQQVGRAVDYWERVSRAIEDLYSRGRGALTDSSLAPEVSDGIRQARLEELSSYAVDAITELTAVRHRLERDTVNIGVSGRARVGKSTLLQTLAGLTDQEIPTGSGLPVTAVRSRIFHSTGEPGSTIRFHTDGSFLSEVVAPYTDKLQLGPTPASVESFAGMSLTVALGDDRHEDESLRRRLCEIQTALPTFRHLLTGIEQRVPLSELRPYVAYPRPQDGELRPYLAVRQVKIDCRFPRTDVGRVGLLDLPGLGEIAPGAERRHVRDLREEVDIVLLVKRPVEGLAFWDKTDQRGFGLLEEACAPANTSDFVVPLVNVATSDDAHLRATLVGQFESEVIAGRPFLLLEADASSAESVDQDVLQPVIEHLLERLPKMDVALISRVVASCEGRRRDLVSRVEGLRTSIRAPLAGSVQEELFAAAADLRQQLARDLQSVVADLKQRVAQSVEDTAYVEAVGSAYASVKEWIDSGFGLGREVWIASALAAMRADLGSGPFATSQLNAIRVDISQRFTAIDSYFSAQVDSLWSGVADALRGQLGERLVPVGEPKEALMALRHNLLTSDEPCPVLAEAISDLLAVRLDYRAQLHPRVREQAELLMPTQRDPETQEVRATVVVEPTETGATTLFRDLAQLAEQVAHRTRQALFAEAVLPARVLFAAAEQFEDAAIRSSNAEIELRAVARSFRDDVWPGRFSNKQTAALHVREVIRAAESLAELVDQAGEKS